MKIRPMGAELFHADGRTDGQTDMMKLIVVFRSFANLLKSPSASLSPGFRRLQAWCFLVTFPCSLHVHLPKKQRN